jgi:hypothetical protein
MEGEGDAMLMPDLEGGRKLRMLAAAAFAATLILAQSAPPRLEFEVASIKPTAPGGDRAFMGTKGPGRFDAENIPVRTFIAEAYGVKTFEIYGAPAWLGTDSTTSPPRSRRVQRENKPWKK